MRTETPCDAATLNDALESACERLLELRGDHGHWEGELSSSPLSTATAVSALTLYRDAQADGCDSERDVTPVVDRGLDWLVETQNADGGWGDTTRSISNVSTTALCWAAIASVEIDHIESVAAAEHWLAEAAGGLAPAKLSAAIRNRYGRDQTFSVPILTALALRGRLGDADTAWRHVPQLPFELAAFPHQWFAVLRLPVVSYALPALIAIGLVRHQRRPSSNPLARWLRNATRRRALRVLQQIQPTSGGYLEATPLTSFVVMSLIGAGLVDHQVVTDGIRFLLHSARTDGSWPIDTNLATWVSTLSVQALASARKHDLLDAQALNSRNQHADTGIGDAAGAERLRRWLLLQQYREEHPYTHAAPGGWAWTDLAGGVPDADDTPGALLALKTLDDGSEVPREAAVHGVQWLIDLQNSDGGMPTFCRGWGKFPFDRSSPDLSAHAVRAWLAWDDQLPTELRNKVHRAIHRALRYLARTQTAAGAWAPLWFGNQHSPAEANLTYGTSRVLLALLAAHDRGWRASSARPNIASALDWLVESQNLDGGWGGEMRAVTPSSIEETALALEALSVALAINRCASPWLTSGRAEHIAEAARQGTAWLVEHTDGGRCFPPEPIGFYFAKLWYYERMYPLIYTVAALGRAAEIDRHLFGDRPPAPGETP